MGSVEIPEASAEPGSNDVGPPQNDSDKGKTDVRQDVIWCLDTNSGATLWRHGYPAKLIDILHEGGPAATPTLHDGRGYTVSKEGHFVCFDINTGAPFWTKELVQELGVKMPYWGFSGSPLIFEGVVIVEAGKTVAFDRLTGELVWQTENYRAGYSSPIVFPHPQTNEPLIASLNNDVLLIVRAKDGSEVAQAPFVTAHPTNACTPIVQGDTIFLSSGYNRGCTLFRLTGTELEVQYDNRNMRNHMNSCVLRDGYLYGFDGNSHTRRNAMIKCINHETGEIAWKERGYGVGSLLLAADKLIALSGRRRIVSYPRNT